MGRAAVGSVRVACSVGRRVRSIRAAALRAGGAIGTVGTALLLFEQGKNIGESGKVVQKFQHLLGVFQLSHERFNPFGKIRVLRKIV